MGRSKLKTCGWCHKPTNLPEVFAAETPILEWFEKKIERFCDKNNVDKKDLWGNEANWDRVKISPQMEAELLAYDELLITVNRKTICKDCLIEDQKLWNKYYDSGLGGDFEINIDDLQ